MSAAVVVGKTGFVMLAGALASPGFQSAGG